MTRLESSKPEPSIGPFPTPLRAVRFSPDREAAGRAALIDDVAHELAALIRRETGTSPFDGRWGDVISYQ